MVIKMKKFLIAVLLAAVVVGVAACGESAASAATPSAAETQPAENDEANSYFTFVPAGQDFTASEVTAAILETVPINSSVEKGIDDLPIYFDALDTSGVSDASYCMCASGAYPDEIAVLKFDSAELAKAGAEAVKARLESQRGTYESYKPDEMYKFDGSVAEARGCFAVYLITSDNAAAKEILNRYIP